MKFKIFVDGQEGTTGLQIYDYLSVRNDIEVLKIDSDKRKDINERKRLINSADLVFLCLPDAAAVESVSLIENENTRVIDASTAHRTNPEWVYGFPELDGEQRQKIRESKRVANPGCHATGFSAIAYPLVKLGIMPKDYPVTCYSITGYSGGGKSLIQKYESPDSSLTGKGCPKPYALKLVHKHLPEMKKVNDLDFAPVFAPILGNFYKGMAVSIPLSVRLLDKKLSAEEVRDMLADYYKDEKFIRVMPFEGEANLDENGFLNAEGCNDTNRIDLFVFGHEDQILLTAVLDNLGKGASGAAIQSMNIMLGFEEDLGLKY